MKRKLLSTFLALCMLLSLLPTAALAAETGTTLGPDTSWYNTSSTEFALSDAADLLGFASIINGTADGIAAETFAGKTVKLSADIDVQGGALNACTKVFRGTFDGQNHVIKNFTIDAPLFSNIGNKDGCVGSVKNLTIESAALNNTTGSQPRLGIVCRNLNGTMESVHVKNCTITSETEKLGVVGGLVAMTQNGCCVSNCSVTDLTVDARGGALAVGGAVGLLIGDVTTSVSNVTATNTTITGAAKGTSSEKKEVGMSVGAVWSMDASNGMTITGCSGDYPDVSGLNAVANIGDTYFETIQAAVEAAATDDTVKVLKDITIAVENAATDFELVSINGKKLTIDLNGKTISFADPDSTDRGEAWYTIFGLTNGADVTITGNGTLGNASSTTENEPIWLHNDANAKLTIENGTFYGLPAVYISVGGGNVTVNGGWFENTATGTSSYYNNYLLNCAGDDHGHANGPMNDTKRITIYGGTLVNADPQKMNDGDMVDTASCVKASTREADNATLYTVAVHGKDCTSAVTKDPTYTEAGERTYSCANCGKIVKTEEIAKLTHSSGGGGGSSVTQYAITVADTQNGSVTADKKRAAKNTTVTLTVSPAQGCTLETLTVTDKNGAESKLTDKGDGTYTFQMPDSKVTVTSVFQKEAVHSDFVDVPTDSYYYDAVQWAAQKGITQGVDDTHFAPDASCTRAQIVTFLWRTAGSPTAAGVTNFVDVPADSYYATAVAWAVDQGIVKGTSETTFSPDEICTRSHAVTFLFRYAEAQEVDTTLTSGFLDAAQIPGYALPAFNWALADGIVQGADGNLMPNDACTRAQIVTLLYRLAK